MPAANDLASARSKDYSSDVFPIVFVVEAVFSNLTHVMPAGLPVPMIVDTSMSTLCSFIAFTSWNTSILNSTMKLSLCPYVCASSSFFQVLGFVVRIWLHRFSAFHPVLMSASLRRYSCHNDAALCSRMRRTIRQFTLAQFLLVDVYESSHPCLCGNTL